ncbi:nucleosome-destabilizing factor [Dermatophagoides farinae]|mgnify:FL=1|uniref:Cytokine-like nuclear factor N-PAC n=1 Tax=Dermatophagoides farinae TaxID=6954 RepID=A0A922L9G7_DERFA|nr:putative oxidoreductase GLYR1 homolog [Dermatophagoides farinae]KAH7641609.1 oxidoreductase glyr1-like protein [Dermatophagoides farinae]KAH9527499.1 putative oxidoreductase glyr1 [Dermatophagoides farinae]
MAELTSTSDSKYKLDDLVWAKVKGFNYWPAIIVPDDQVKNNRKIKNAYSVRFFGSEDFGRVTEDNIKPYEEFREQFTSGPKKSKLFKIACEKIEEQWVKQKGTSAITNVTSTTPDNSKFTTDVFKAKKITMNSPSPLTRDYSRTPFKREKRNFDNSNETETVVTSVKKPATPVKATTAPAASVSHDASKRMKPAVQSSSSPVHETDSPLKAEPRITTTNAKQTNVVSEMKLVNKSNRSKPSSLKFGFIGLGKVGQSLAKLLIDSGHELTIWDRTPNKCKDFEKLGANSVKTPGDVVRESDITFSCLNDSSASQSIFFGNCGISGEIDATKGYVELTSMDYTISVEIDNWIKSKGGRYLEAPLLLSSLPEQIEQGEMMALVAGNRSLFDDCSSCFETFSSHVYFLSENVGVASKMNVTMSIYYASQVAALMECTTLIERLGLINKDFIDIITKSPLNSSWIENNSSSLIDMTLIRDIPMDHIRRDLSYCLRDANRRSFPTPMTSTVNEVLKQKKHFY